ncbi:indole-3-glycerol phosphate synthase TrpC [Reichenbachiella sp. MSK19-1]|uniref:indole-3-glycerol phosphate synthase TrpC n=1 Tax=Reichenbachiella sp. MSK19-1 TaxID=1897631 RepID=UPI000E6B9DCB|nr:indole-3-glycerol phosphate synthase TrpC [Reichenbachiella sp. MSK19-1]RJE75351.1 indole-3-glycerol phosphate synthase [Reichenbachiella sp. MSK19-1]
MNVLDKIVAEKRKEVAAQKALFSIDQLTKMPDFDRSGISTAQRLKSSVLPGIISEFKRQSPSKGVINDRVDVMKVAKGYCEAGASAVSILTDEPFFGGTIEDLQRARPHVTCPILRKDFIIDEYQIYKTKAIGADLMLLIAAILTKEEIAHFTKVAHDLGLEVLLEIHNEEEFRQGYIPEVDILGVNNRDLKRFKTTIQNSIDLSEVLPKEQLKISESGISTTKDMAELIAVGYKGFLIGEQFMKHDDPAAELKKFMTEELV